MADHFFPNVLPDFVAETTHHEEETEDTLIKLLSMPYSSLSQHFKRTALDLKQTIALETWGVTAQNVSDFTLYCVTLGTAFLLLKSYRLTNYANDLYLCLIKLSKNLPDELLYGRAGYLWACLFLNKHLGEGTIPSKTKRAVIDEIIKNGRTLGQKGGGSPLMFEWYGEKYWGAAHGLAGIMHVLMDVELKPDEAEDVKSTLRYMIRNRFPSGNYPASEQDRKYDVLVHWCHGAPGIALTLVKAAEVFGDDEFLEAAMGAAEVVWNRNVKFLYRAKAFASFLLDQAHKLISKGEMHGGDSPYSLFEGIGGMVYLFLDMIDPIGSRFPAYEL
ncbi:LanC-like protein GCR2 [Hibiscus syriacus]|uniref:LanC-like protein GCR2 n=1 Tax=Hibiscus syriacus TaxID=106335 RepID=A0A6A2Z7W5_HIBSY|nr:LanC-like protein GCR2 [Hibiscus syriacus]